MQAAFSFDYFADFETLGRHLAKIHVIDTTINKNRWQVTDEALHNALNSLIGKPLIAHPDHCGEVTIGSFIDAMKVGDAGVGIAEITDSNAWEKIVNNEWKWISPKVTAFDIMERDGIVVLNEFYFDHVAFVPQGAYPHAHVLSTFAGQESGLRTFSAALTEKLEEQKVTQATAFTARVIPFKATPKAPEDTPWDYREADYEVDQLRRACARYDSENPDVKTSYKLPHHLPDGRVGWRGVAAAMAALLGARGGVDIPAADRRGCYIHLRRHYAQFDKEPPEFEGQKTEGENWKMSENTQALEAKLAEANEKIEKLEAANKNLRELLDKKTNTSYEAEIAKLKAAIEKRDGDIKKLRESVDTFEGERHANKVQELLGLRSQLGFVPTNPDLERFQGMSDEILDQLITDTKDLVESGTVVAGPRAKYSGSKLDPTETWLRK